MEHENIALVRKGKEKKRFRKGSNSQSEKKNKKKHISMIKCFGFHEYSHYARNFLERKKGKKQVTTSTSAEELSNRMEDEFALIACINSSTS